MSRILECGVLLRVYTLFMAGLYAYAQLYAPETLMYAVAHTDDFALIMAWVLGACSILGFIDLVVNDVLPDRFVLARALHDRHLVLMAIPLCFAVQMFTAVKYDFPYIILAYYSVYIFMVPASAFTDLRKRYKNKECP
jgi:hypothetical protein